MNEATSLEIIRKFRDVDRKCLSNTLPSLLSFKLNIATTKNLNIFIINHACFCGFPTFKNS